MKFRVELVLRDPENGKVEIRQVKAGNLKELGRRLLEISASKTVIIGEAKETAAGEKG